MWSEPSSTFRVVDNCREIHVRRGFQNANVRYHAKITRLGRQVLFQVMIPHTYRLIWGSEACILKACGRRGGYGRISGGLRVLELAADNRKAREGRSLAVDRRS
jgi:hypothetical protein